jgi:2'-5' RNA ligase
MRLFIAIPLDDAARREIDRRIALLRSRSKGNFTLRENLHLTLAFLGEVDAATAGLLPKVLGKAAVVPFPATLAGVGSFRSQGSRTVYVGVDAGAPLRILADAVRKALADAGVAFDSKPFSPHLTIARECDADDALLASLGSLPDVPFRVSSFVLYESRRIEGRLVYRPLRRFGEEDGTH